MYAFFVTYARLAGWTPRAGIDRVIGEAGAWPVLDRWILSRSAALAAEVGARLDDYDATGATRLVSGYIDDLSTWYLRLSRDRMRAGADEVDRDAAFATLHAALVVLARTLAPDPPVRLGVDVRQPDRNGGAGASRQRPPHRLAGR